VLVTEERSAFYAGVNEIAWRTLIILGVAIAAAVALVLVFAGWLTRPLKRVVASMRQIITTNDLGERVEVEYHDEIGQLAQTFNLMVEGLEEAYGHIRRHARRNGRSPPSRDTSQGMSSSRRVIMKKRSSRETNASWLFSSRISTHSLKSPNQSAIPGSW
jgi:methyl-accepting chemotaxis protein